MSSMEQPKTVPKLIPVKSSNVEAVGYDYETRYLYVKFLASDTSKRGALYRYSDVPKRVYERFLRAGSKGKYHWKYVRDKFDYSAWTGFGWRKEAALQRLSLQKKRRKSLYRSWSK